MIINLGDAPFKAFIKVTYPNGTCTVSLGDKSFSHTGGGTHTFTVNKKGTWTVRATSNAGVVETQNVSLTYVGQVASVTLTGILYIFKEGSGAKVPLKTASGTDGSITVGTNYIQAAGRTAGDSQTLVYTTSPINLTHFSSVRFEVSKVSTVHVNFFCRMGVSSSVPTRFSTFDAQTSTASCPNRTTFAINVASRSGKYYIGANNSWNGYIHNIWLVP